MPSSAKQIEQEVKSLTAALREFSEATGGAANLSEIFDQVLKRFSIGGFMNKLVVAKTSLSDMNMVLRSLGKTFGISQAKVDNMTASLARLQKVGRIRFGQGGFNRLEDITGGDKKRSIIGGEIGVAGTGGAFLADKDFADATLGGAKAIQSVNQALQRMNVGVMTKMRFEMSNIGSVTEDAGQKLTTWTATVENSELPTRRATIVTDRWGREVKRTQRQFASFGSSILRNIGKVAQWTIAIAIVYAPIQKLTQIMKEAVAIESKLADAQVVLGTGLKQLNEVWTSSATIARELGVSTEGVVDGYVLAARAAANIVNPTERANATVAVLRDSMLLAKLAGIDQAIALDTLVGALRQLKQPLTEGRDLLDKWVAVSKVANVSIATLAESFAITATAAEGVGITVDKLNGIIAAVAEVTTLSATESGNAVRAFISGFQKDQTERELNRFGISVRNVNGELRNFISIIDDIIARRDVGLISDRELAKISEFIGGGARRGAQINAILENYGRVQELAAVSARANGDATEALGIKMDTVQTAAQNLDNAFTELAKALGDDAGFLDNAKGTLKIVTGVVDIFTALIRVLGKATPALIAFSAAFLALRHSARLQGLLQLPLVQFAQRIPLVGGALSGRLSQTPIGLQGTGAAAGAFFGRGRGAVGGAAIGLLQAGLSGNLSKGNLEKGGIQIGAAIVGFMVNGPLGAIIGATIAESFYSGIVNREADINNLFSDILSKDFFRRPSPEDILDDLSCEEITQQLTKLIAPFRSEIGGNLRVQIARLGLRVSGTKLGGDPTKDFEATLTALASIAADQQEGLGADFISFIFNFDTITPEAKEKIRLILKRVQEEEVEKFLKAEPTKGTPFTRAIVVTAGEAGQTAQEVFRARRGEVIGDVGRGQRGVRELRELEDLGQVFDNQMDTIFTAMTLNGQKDALDYKDSAKLIIEITEEERKGIIDLANGVGQLFDEFEKITQAGEGAGIQRVLRESVTDAQKRLNETITLVAEGRKFKAFDLPQFIDIDQDAIISDLELAVANAREISKSFIAELTLDDAEAAKIESTWGIVALRSVETWKVALKDIEGVSPEILKKELEKLDLLSKDAQEIGIQTPDITRADFRKEVAARLPGINALIEQIRPLDLQDLGFIFKDNVTDILHVDQLAIQLLLRDIRQLNEDQLEGIFNIPAGITAVIPVTGTVFFSRESFNQATGTEDLLGGPDGTTEELVATGGPAPPGLQEFMEEQFRRKELKQSIFESIGRTLDAMEGIIARETGEIGLDKARQFITENPELKSLPVFRQGGLEGIRQLFFDSLPQSIPVTINTRIINPITVIVDGIVVQKVMEERHFEDLASATRRSGAVGYIME